MSYFSWNPCHDNTDGKNQDTNTKKMDVTELVVEADLPAMGRNVTIGYLYDIRRDKIINRSLWNDRMRSKMNSTIKRNFTDVKIEASDTFEQRTSLMNIGAEASLTSMGLVNVSGSAHFINSRNSSSKTSSVTLKYHTIDRYERLTENQLSHIQYREVLDIEEATHIISDVTYGNDAYVKFEKELEEGQTKVEVQTGLKAQLESIMLKDGVELDIERAKEKKMEGINCKFTGDFELTKLPVTFESAMAIMEEISANKTEKVAVPISFGLTPLKQLGSTAIRLVRSISQDTVAKAWKLKNYQETCLQELDDLLQSEIFNDNAYADVRNFVKKVKDYYTESDLKFKQRLCDILPQIKGSGFGESKLLSLLTQFENSSFGRNKFEYWYTKIQKEIGFMEVILKSLGTSNNSLDNINLCRNIDDAKALKITHGYGISGWYQLNMNLLSCLDNDLLAHLQRKLLNDDEEDTDNYPVASSFVGDGGGDHFFKVLTRKVKDFKRLASLEGTKTRKVSFVAITNYPGTGENTAVIDFEGDGSENSNAIKEQLLSLESLEDETLKIGSSYGKKTGSEDNRTAIEIKNELGNKFNTICVMEIRNKSILRLEADRVAIWMGSVPGQTGKDTIGLPTVKPGYSEVMSMRKRSNLASGTSGVAIWKIGETSKRLYVMWSIPYDQNTYKNRLAVMVSDQADIRTKVQHDRDDQLTKEMYYHKDKKIKELTEIKEFRHENQDELVYDKDPDLNITATMESGPRCLISVDFALSNFNDAI